jgi:hypothetical protein
MSRRPLVITAAAILVISGTAFAAPAAGEIGSGVESATDGDPVTIAISHVQQHFDEFAVSPADVSDLLVQSSYTSRHNGLTHVNLTQRYEGLEVFGGHATVNVTGDGDILYVGNSLLPDLRIAESSSGDLGAVEAVEAAAEELDLDRPQNLRIMSAARTIGGVTTLSDGGISDEPITAKVGWQPTDDGLRQAWQVVIDDSTDVHLWNATIDAATGEMLAVDDWTVEDAHDDLAERLGRADGQTSAAVETLSSSATVFRPANPVDDGSSYRIYPQESPDDGDRILDTNPADGTASPFGWHDVSGAPGADFTITRGNNVHAYTDRDASNDADPGSEPDGGAGLSFDFPIDLNEHPQNYVEASLTNYFRWCNITHDLFYLYGFDEEAGNFQVNNYGRGGVGGDDVRCESMDGSFQSNANFSTPAADGGRPRMQTAIEFGSGLPNAVTVDSGPAAGTYLAHYARFSPAPTTAGISGTLVLVDDGTGAPNDGCEPYSLPPGSIAVVDTTGVCNNYTQTVNAQNAGAVAVVVVHTADNPAIMNGTMVDPVSIPAIRVGQADGNTIKVAIAGEPAPGSVHRNTGRPPMRVGDLDTATVLHEYGHGLSNRMTGGPGVNCLSGQEQMGEGWSDFVALVALIDTELDDPDGVRGIFPYVVFQPPRTGPGLRPRPYSRTWDIQPFTYDSIKTGGWLNGGSLSAPHGIGHGWAAVLWDMTWDLIDRHGFNPNLYDDWSTGGNNLAFQLVLDGLKIQGCNPTLVTGRDAILAADQALTGGENVCTIWASFARRGLGFSADDGGTTSRNDGTEAFDSHPDCVDGFAGQVADQPAVNTVAAGRTVPLMFDRPDLQGLDILASNSPFSRRVDCETFEVPSENPPNTTPRAAPGTAETPGDAALTRSTQGRYTFPWQTEEEWVGTCREFVMTLDNGQQHRAYFEFVEAE